MPPDTSTVDFHFDVLCPYAYQTSKWIRAVRDEEALLEEMRRREQGPPLPQDLDGVGEPAPDEAQAAAPDAIGVDAVPAELAPVHEEAVR